MWYFLDSYVARAGAKSSTFELCMPSKNNDCCALKIQITHQRKVPANTWCSGTRLNLTDYFACRAPTKGELTNVMSHRACWVCSVAEWVKGKRGGWLSCAHGGTVQLSHFERGCAKKQILLHKADLRWISMKLWESMGQNWSKITEWHDGIGRHAL